MESRAQSKRGHDDNSLSLSWLYAGCPKGEMRNDGEGGACLSGDLKHGEGAGRVGRKKVGVGGKTRRGREGGLWLFVRRESSQKACAHRRKAEARCRARSLTHSSS